MREDDELRPGAKRLLNLRGESAHGQRVIENREALGGMRNPAKSVKKAPGHVEVGKAVSETLENF